MIENYLNTNSYWIRIPEVKNPIRMYRCKNYFMRSKKKKFIAIYIYVLQHTDTWSINIIVNNKNVTRYCWDESLLFCHFFKCGQFSRPVNPFHLSWKKKKIEFYIFLTDFLVLHTDCTSVIFYSYFLWV